MIVIPQISEIVIRQEGERVVVIRNGKALLDLPWDAAQALANALRVKALSAEEEAKALAIAFDQAILMRAGVPFGLSSRSDIVNEARKEAAWNSDLRRYMPGGIKAKAIFGQPSVIRLQPPGGK